MGKRIHVLFGHLKIGRLIPARAIQRLRHSADRTGSRFRNQLDTCRLALRAVDRRGLVAFGLENRSLFLAVCQVDFFLALTFRLGDQRALLALRGNLRLHRAQNRFRRRQIFDFIAQHFHAPGAPRLVQHRNHLSINLVTTFESLVEFHFADFRTQSGLRQLGDRRYIIGRSIRSQFRVGDLVINNAVHPELRVVAGNTDLLLHIQRSFLQRMPVGHAVEERHNHIQPRFEHGIVFAHALDHPRHLLRHLAYRLDGHHHPQRHDEKRQRE